MYSRDFYIPKAKLIIEVDGAVHFNEKAAAKDLDRTYFFNSLGIEVIRFKNEEVCNSFKKVCKSIRQAIDTRLQLV
jgi:very-short-patch-repair endonuclease